MKCHYRIILISLSFLLAFFPYGVRMYFLTLKSVYIVLVGNPFSSFFSEFCVNSNVCSFVKLFLTWCSCQAMLCWSSPLLIHNFTKIVLHWSTCEMSFISRQAYRRLSFSEWLSSEDSCCNTLILKHVKIPQHVKALFFNCHIKSYLESRSPRILPALSIHK